MARHEGRTAEFPVKAKAKPVPHYEIAVGVIWKSGKVLIARRRADQMLGGLWEFPGGKRQGSEALAETARREIREETGLVVEVGTVLATVEHAYSHFSITLTAFECHWRAGTARARSAAEVKWVVPQTLADYPFPTANRKFLARIGTAPASGRPGLQ